MFWYLFIQLQKLGPTGVSAPFKIGPIKIKWVSFPPESHRKPGLSCYPHCYWYFTNSICHVSVLCCSHLFPVFHWIWWNNTPLDYSVIQSGWWNRVLQPSSLLKRNPVKLISLSAVKLWMDRKNYEEKTGMWNVEMKQLEKLAGFPEMLVVSDTLESWSNGW